MKIGKHAVASVQYKLTVDGELMDQSEEGQPLVFLSGVGAMIPGFEKGLQGLMKGDSYEISIDPKDGYGEYDSEAVVELPQDTFKVEGELQKDDYGVIDRPFKLINKKVILASVEEVRRNSRAKSAKLRIAEKV